MLTQFKKRLALLLVMVVAVTLFIPLPSFGEATSPSLWCDETKVLREEPGTLFFIGVDSPAKGAKYTATVSDNKVAKLVNAYKDSWYVNFVFYAKKSGKVKITIRQTLNGKTKKLGTKTITIKSKKFSSKQKSREKLYQKVVNQGSLPSQAGVSLEVLKITNVKNGSDKITAKVTLKHKVTAEELKVNGKKFSVAMMDSDYRTINLTGTLKKGAKTVTVSVNKKKLSKAEKKKGKKYYVTGLRTKSKAPYRLKVTI